jgi:hypothetical protein
MHNQSYQIINSIISKSEAGQHQMAQTETTFHPQFNRNGSRLVVQQHYV